MIELAFTILFFISIFAIIKSARGERSEEDDKRDRNRKQKKSLWWHMWHDENHRSSGYYY